MECRSQAVRGISFESRVASRELRVARGKPQSSPRASRPAPRNSQRRAISLIEVLISMFVLLFGLMGVAAIFPVGNHFVVEGEKFDLGSAMAQNAFEELKARGLLRPQFWHYAEHTGLLSGVVATTQDPPAEYITQVIQPDLIGGAFNNNRGFFNITSGSGPGTPAGPGPGHAFVIDPMGAVVDVSLPHFDVFPRFTDRNGDVRNTDNPAIWFNATNFPLSGQRWPVRRVTVLDANALMRTEVAETICRLRDDLVVEQPDESDVPSLQLWRTADVQPNGTANNTIDDPRDDQLLLRQYKGDYSWLATVVPTTDLGRRALQPADDNYGEIACDLSVVVFRKRELTAEGSERLIQAELLPGGEVLLYSDLSNNSDARDEVDDALEGLRSGDWIPLMGVNQTTGDFVMKWYRILSMGNEDDTERLNVPSLGTGINATGRRAMLSGPDWPPVPNGTGGSLAYVPNLRAGILPGAISVVTKPIRMEHSSLWSLE